MAWSNEVKLLRYVFEHAGGRIEYWKRGERRKAIILAADKRIDNDIFERWKVHKYVECEKRGVKKMIYKLTGRAILYANIYE